MNWIRQVYDRKYLITALLFSLVSVFVTGSIDIAIHETYYVISRSLIFLFFALFFLLFEITEIVFKKSNRPISKKILTFHWAGSVICILILITIGAYQLNSEIEQNYLDTSISDELDDIVDKTEFLNGIIIGIPFIFLLVQLILCFAILRSLIKTNR